MSRKDKKKDKQVDEVVVDDFDLNNDDSYDLDDEDFPKSSKELKKEAKEAKKKEKKEELEATDEILNSKSKTKAGQTFKMYKFIIKIFIFAVLLAFGIVMLIYQAELVGAVYLVTGIIITFSALIRMVPLIKTTKSNRARLITFVQCLIHLVLGIYLVLAAFYHWNKLNEYAQALADHKVAAFDKNKIEDMLKEVHAGWAVFNLRAYAYILVGYLFTLSVGYYWVTIRFNEKSSKSLFWLMTVSNTLAVAFALVAEHLQADILVIVIAVLSILASLVVAGEAGGGYYRYRKALVADKPKKQAKVENGKEAPARNEEVDYTDIDPNTIPVDEPQDDANIVS